jgi:hypothetical protein
MRYALAALAVVLSALLVPVGITASWLSLRVDSTAAYVDTVEPLAEDPDLREVLAREVADATVDRLEELVPVGLPAALGPSVRATTDMVVESDAFPEFWRKANADAHKEFLAIVHERDEDVVADGWVYIDISPLIDEVAADFMQTVPTPVQVDLPPSPPLNVPVVPKSELDRGRAAYQVLDALALWIPLLWVGLVAVVLIVTPGWRGRLRAGAACAVGVVLGGGLILLLTPSLTDAVVEQVDSENRDLARLVIEVVVSTLDDAARGAAFGGVVVAVLFLATSLWPRRRETVTHP